MSNVTSKMAFTCALVWLGLAACGESKPPEVQGVNVDSSESQPPAVQNVDEDSGSMVGDCNASGFNGGSLSGLGAAYPMFAKAHPSASSQGVTTRCTPENYVSLVSIKPAVPLSETHLLADKTVFAPYLPSDAVRTKTTTGHLFNGAAGCRVLHYRSSLLAAVSQVHSQNGQFVVVFESPPNAYSRNGITEVFVDLTGDLGGC
jgi:hypothetical protein